MFNLFRNKPCTRPRIRLAAGAALAACASIAAAPAAADAANKASIPRANVIKNPTFERSTKGWKPLDAKVKRVRDRKAPHGRRAAKVTGRNVDAYWLNGAPAKLGKGSRARTSYTGRAWVRGTGRTAGKHVNLVVREVDRSGELVKDSYKKIKLKRRYRKLTVSLQAKRNGSRIDMYLARPEGDTVRRDVFYADALTLTADKGKGPKPPVPPPPPGGPVPNTTGQIALVNSHEEAMRYERGSRYRYLVIRDGLRDHVDDLRAANPDSKILLYKDLSFAIKDEPGCPHAPFEVTGVSYCTADSQESWFLHDSAGQRLTSASYPYLYAMDISDPGYRQTWLDAVRKRLVDSAGDGSGVRWDGVYIDDTNLYPGHGMNGRIAELSDADYRQATLDFVATVSPALQAEGFLTMANVGMDMYDPAQKVAAIRLARTIDVYNREYFVRWSGGEVFTTPHDQRGNEWTDELEHMEAIQQTGASYSAVVYGATNEAEVQRYARATFLLGWDGRPGSALIFRATNASDAWGPDWTTDIGFPTGARFGVGDGWRRNFTGGTTIVNPHPHNAQVFKLDGSFRRADGSCTDNVRLAPGSALVLPSC